MLALKHAEGEIYNLSLGPEHTVGRLGNLELSKDPSVSRQHARIKVSVKNGQFQIILHDLGSKYGTYVVEEGSEKLKEVPKNSDVPLKLGDSIRFGQLKNIWKLVEETFVISTSTLTGSEKSFMNKMAAKLNGILVSDWTENCTHLTMNSIKITVKVVCALGHVKPIVTVDYWKHLFAALTSENETPLPDYINFIPNLEEPQLVASDFDFKMKTERKTLFQDKHFIVFGDSQYNSVLPMVKAAGGKVSDGKKLKMSKEQFLNGNIIVIQPTEKEAAAAKSYMSILKGQRLRLIQELEICLSVASCSLDRYCNPEYDMSVLLKQPGTQANIKDNATVLAPETQDEDTEYQGALSGSNFSLTVNDNNRVFSESDDDNAGIGDSDVSVIEDSGDFSVTNTRSTRSAGKRKLEQASGKPAKCSKLDSWVISHKRATNSSDNSESMVSGSTASKKPIHDIFSFGNENKKSSKNSSSLFGGISERLKQNSRNVRTTRNSSEQSTSSFLSASRASEESSASVIAASNDRPTRRSTKSLFAGLNAKSEKESPALFSSTDSDRMESRQSTRSHPEESNKRKISDDFGPSTSKKANKNTRSLFEPPAESRKPATVGADSEDQTDGFLEKETATKLTISKAVKTSTAPPMPVVEVPSTVSLSQFMDVSTINVNIKTEPLELPTQVQEVLDKTIVLTVPLMKNSSPRTVRRQTDDCKVNFKNFRKNPYQKSPKNVIPASALLLYIPKTEIGDDD